LKSSIPRDWRRILGRWVTRAFVYAAAATARREQQVETFSQSSKRPELLADEIPGVPGAPLRKSHGRVRAWHLAKAVCPRSSGEEGVVAVDLNPEGLSNYFPAPASRVSGSRLIRFTIALLALSPLTAVHAQHASDDPLASANDAFGLTLGLERNGLYGPGGVRGFNPQAAGNVRIDGLYFDQQGALSNRVVEGSTIRIGVSEIGYAFPAPTGIVDYDLRHSGNGTPSATVVASAGPFQAHGLSVDGNLPLISRDLQLPIGASLQTSTNTPAGWSNPGYTSKVANVGATPQWKPNDWLNFRGIVDWTQTTHAKTLPFVFTAGDYLPPYTPRGYYGQNWAEGRSRAENFGGIVTARLATHWSLAAGVFRSIADAPVSYEDLYLNTLPKGSAEQFVVGNPEQRISSTSGEARLVGRFGTGSWRHEVVFLARGRDTVALYGGSDVVDVGPAFIDQGIQAPEPIFSYTARTEDRTELWSAGFAYCAQRQGHGDFAVGFQQENYDKNVSSPRLPAARLTDHPLRAYGNAALALGERVTAYGGYTQGLEDSGAVPSVAANRGTILPDARTWQTDAGFRFLLTSKLKVIVGVFEIEKPYFNFATNNVDHQLGVQRARGVELSLSGEVVRNLHVAVGALLGEVKIMGSNLAAAGVGTTAFGQPHNQGSINANYKFPWLPALSADVTFLEFGTAPASVDDVAQNNTETWLAVGSRYRFTLWGAPATLRVQVQNATNFHFWNYGYSPGFSQLQPRAYVAYLAADI
jgi:iron complex outermembrane receptor protein